MRVIEVGNVRLQQEDTDVFVYYFGPGMTEPGHLLPLAMAEQAAWAAGASHIFSIAVLDPASTQAPGFFVEAAKLWRKSPSRSSAFVSRDFKLRNSMEFFIRAMRFLGSEVDLVFFDEEQPARAWLLACKEKKSQAKKR